MAIAENITVSAELGYLEYIDGYFAQITSMKPEKNQDDEDCWCFILNPTDKLIKRYKLKPNSNNNMLYEVKIPVDMVVQLNADPANTRWLCLLNYKGETTNVSNILTGVSQQKEIADLRMKFRKESIRAEIANENLGLMQNNLPQYIKRNFAPLMEQFMPVIEKQNQQHTK